MINIKLIERDIPFWGKKVYLFGVKTYTFFGEGNIINERTSPTASRPASGRHPSPQWRGGRG